MNHSFCALFLSANAQSPSLAFILPSLTLDIRRKRKNSMPKKIAKKKTIVTIFRFELEGDDSIVANSLIV